MKRTMLLIGLSLFLSVPSSIFAEDAVFKKTKQVYQDGEKSKERDVALVFQDEKIVIKHRKEPAIYTEIPNATLTELTYERSKHPRTMTAILVSPMFLFSSGKKHWLTIQYKTGEESAYILLKLDKKEYQRIIAEAETRTGLEVKRVMED